MRITEMSAIELHREAAHQFGKVVAAVRDDQWALPTPCEAWDVRALVNHVVGEARWTQPLLAGLSIADVGHSLDGDLLGADPLGAWNAACATATEEAAGEGVTERVVQLSFGDTPAEEYLRQLAADYLVHSWDLAIAIGADSHLDADLVSAVTAWFADMEPHYRAAGVIGPRPAVKRIGEPQELLLAMYGRDASGGNLSG
jgi:uncharacterized protein (TIGR03086 family)